MKNTMNSPHSWADLERQAARTGGLEDLARLKQLLSPEDAHFLLRQLRRLDEPALIRKLNGYQRMQEAWGGSFYGMLPDQLCDEEIPIPNNFPTLLRTAVLLAEVRERNLAALRRINPDYPLEFRRQPFPSLQSMRPPATWRLELDLSAMREVLRLLRKKKVAWEEAAAVAALPAFAEMMRHRRELGYLPEPLITQEGMAHLLQHAASRAPLDMIWKWLNSQNFFDLADIAFHWQEYEVLVTTLAERADDIARHILGAIAVYAHDEMREMRFHDRVSFAVGWGIAGWATTATGGINIEHFKDDYPRLLTTLTHETFHRLQLRVCPVDPALAEAAPSFESLTRFPFRDERDGKFYEILSTIFLEGTATFIAPAHPPADREESVRRGAKMLAECFRAIYHRGELERANELLNEGLKSNGPFYWLGAHMAEEITARHGNSELGRVLRKGSPEFFRRYLTLESDVALHPRQELETQVRKLASFMASQGGERHK